MFQFRRFPSYTYLIQYRIPCGGFPHSEISGSLLICSSPKLIAAYHVLHRLLMPRHSPCALISLTSSESASATLRFRRQLWAVAENCVPLRCSSSQIQTRLRWALNLLGTRFARCALRLNLVTSRIIHFYLVSLVELCRLNFKKFLLAKIVFYPIKNFPLCCLLIIAS